MIELEKFSEAMSWSSEDVEARLPDPAYAEQLIAILGKEVYEDSKRILAAGTATSRGGKKGIVFIVPGVIGSKLGYQDRGILSRLANLIWLNPLNIIGGKLADLKMSPPPLASIAPFGVFLHSYQKLKMTLEREGYDARFFPYDWRLPLAESAKTFARELAQHGNREVMIVAHSMGGLLTRAALARDEQHFPNVKRIITLGTPHKGSFSPVPLLRGKHKLLSLAAWADGTNDADFLAGKVFATMPGFYELLPNLEVFDNHLFDMSRWPGSGNLPTARLLSDAVRAQADLRAPDDRFLAIIGHGNVTLSGANIVNNDFQMMASRDGDGAVLLKSSEIQGIPAWYTTVEHGQLANGEDVRRAVVDLLATGTSNALPQQKPKLTNTEFPEPKRQVNRGQSRTFAARNGKDMINPSEIRNLLSDFAADASPPETFDESAKPERPVTSGPGGISVVSMNAGPDPDDLEPRQFDLRLFCGSITDASARAYAVGVFEGVKPAGAAGALDHQMDGALQEFHTRNMISGAQAWINAFPASRRSLRADLVCLVGLGHPGHLTADGVVGATANLVRFLINAGYEDCALVSLGAGSNLSHEESLSAMVKGALQAVSEAAPGHFFRGITICEINPDGFDDLKNHIDAAVVAARPSKLINVRRTAMKAAPASAPARMPYAVGPALPYATNVVILSVSSISSEDNLTVTFNVLGDIRTATSLIATSVLLRARFDDLFKSFRFNGIDDIDAFNRKVWNEFLPLPIREVLDSLDDHHVIINHDRLMSRIPWETLVDGKGRYLAVTNGISRKYASLSPTVGKWLKRQDGQAKIRVLLIVDPTGDLPGAQKEAQALSRLFSEQAELFDIDMLRSERATKAAILAKMGSGQFDIVHYAGHAYYDAESPASGGLIAADGTITSVELTVLASMPPVIFFNACESGRIRKSETRIRESVSVAETILNGGVASFIGTYWPVGDAAAETFASTFYGQILDGVPLKDALKAGRKALLDSDSHDWADYMHFGNYEYIIREKP